MSNDYQQIEKAISFLEQHAPEQPSLEKVASHVQLSPFHFQRLFKRWAGVSPKRFLQFLTVEHAKQLLLESASVLETSYEVGMSGPGRLHDLFVSVDAVTPGEFKRQGQGVEINYAFQKTPFGEAIVAETSRGLCHLAFVDHETKDSAFTVLQKNWPLATLQEDHQTGHNAIEQIFSPATKTGQEPIRVFLKGTNFQIKVWQALLMIPEGKVVSYGDLAKAVTSPNAHRAVGSAAGQNPLACLIPCHRVLRANGEIGGYRWGSTRKRAMLAREAAKSSST
jgi:AraC family transcriptional regulator of adaptative response/methylated-DNA-[protein]-cysteine methyltransferase